MIVGGSEVKSFLFPLPVGKLWGVGEKTEIVMKGLGIGTIGDIAKMSPAEMERVFGKNGVHMWQLANGIDERGVERTADPARSVSNEHTFEEDTGDLEAVKNMIMTLSEKVAFRLRASSLKCGSVILKIRFQDFKTFSKAARLSAPSNFISDIYRAALSKLGEFRIDMDNKVRLIGVGTSGFNSSGWQYDLFEDSSASNRKKEKIHKAMEELKDKFGSGSIGYRSKKDRD
jgi:DNA polymerase-4